MNPSLRKDAYSLIALVLLAGVIFGFRLGSFGLLDPDEPFYTLTAKEMLERRDPSTPVIFGQPQFEKPIFFYWVLYGFFKLFGVNEFASRLGPCLAGILTVIATYLWSKILFKRREIAFISAAILATGVQFIVMSRIVLTDMFLCLFVTAALASFSLGYVHAKHRKPAWLFLFVFCGLGFLTKGPLGLLLPFFGIVSYLLANDEKHLLKEIPWGWGFLTFALIGLPWYAMMTSDHGPGFLRHFFIHENIRRFFIAEHKSSDRFFFYLLPVFVGFFPWTAFVFGGLSHAGREAGKRRSKTQKTYLFLLLSFILPFIFFTYAKSKLLSYMLPVFPLIALIVGAWVYRIYRAVRLKAKPKWPLVLLSFVFLGVLPAAIVLTTLVYNAAQRLGLLAPIAAIAVFFVPLCWFFLIQSYRRNYKSAFFSVLVAMVFFSGISFSWLLPKADAAFSSRNDVASYEGRVRPDNQNFLLASKLFVRGVSYYTGDKNIGVLIEDPRRAFYTKHSVPIFSTLEDLQTIEKNKFPVYCFLRQKELKLLRRIIDARYSISVLETNGQRCLVRLDRAD